MAVRHLYLARHGEADPWGQLTARGRAQSDHLGRRLAALPIDVVWHSPLPRAESCAELVAHHLPDTTLVNQADELIDHIPYVPTADQMPAPWIQFFDGFDPQEANRGRRMADALVKRFTTTTGRDTHEVLITHAYPIAWLVREALGSPAVGWLGLNSANAALTVIECRPELPAELVMFNDNGHLPTELRWTGFGDINRP